MTTGRARLIRGAAGPCAALTLALYSPAHAAQVHSAFAVASAHAVATSPRSKHIDPDDFAFDSWHAADAVWSVASTPENLRASSGFTISSTQVDALASSLGVDDAARSLIHAIADEQRQEYEASWVDLAERRSDAAALWNMLPSDEDDDAAEQIAELSRAITALGEGTWSAFYAEVRVLLTPDQAAALDELAQSELSARVLVARANLGVEAADPRDVAAALGGGFAQRDDVRSVLTSYASQVSSLLSARERAAARAGELSRERYSMDVRDQDRVNKVERDVVEAAVRAYNASRDIAALHERTLASLRSLSTPEQAAVIDRVLEQARDDAGVQIEGLVSVDAYAERFLWMVSLLDASDMPGRPARARGVPLSAEQRAEIDRIRGRLVEEVEPRIRTLTRMALGTDATPVRVMVQTPSGIVELSWEPEDGGFDAFRAAIMQLYRGADVRAIFDAEQRAIRELRAVLTVQQRALIADL